MNQLLILIILLFTILSCDNTAKKEVQGVKNVISNEIVDKIMNCKVGDSLCHEINKEVYKVAIDSVLEEDQFFGIVNPVFIDLDSDTKLEMVSLFGAFHQGCHLGIFTQEAAGWKCLFFEEFRHHYEGVNFSVMNNAAKEKVIVIKNLEARGSGIYKEVAHFFKLINGEVVHCLRLQTDSRIHGWGLYMNQELRTEYKFLSYFGADELNVKFIYSYFPGAIFEKDAPWESHEDIPIIEKNEGMTFRWNTETNKYEPQFKSERNNFGLTEKQLLALDEFGNDTLIISAFKEELEEVLEKGDDQQKLIVKRYYEMVKKDDKAYVPSGGLEQLEGAEEGLRFYGTTGKKE